LPGIRVTNAHRINVAVIKQDARAIADTPQDVAHRVAAHLVKAEFSHARPDRIANRADLAVVAGNGDDVAQKLDHLVMVLGQFLLNSGLRFTNVH
jgi:hypothetical protein